VQIRYEGILSAVDPVNKSMTLVGVRSFGSEGRRNGQNEIPPNENDISEVTFKIEHIKDFRIVEKPNTMLIDPAIISSSTSAASSTAK
jgi:protein LSM14